MDRPIAGAVNGTVIQSAQCLYGKVIRAYDPRFYGRKDNKKKDEIFHNLIFFLTI